MTLRTARTGCCILAMLASLPAHADAVRSGLSAYYAELEATLLSRGGLRSDRGGPERLDPARLEHDFMTAALVDEYGGGFTAGTGSRRDKPLLRWEEPVRIRVSFGESVPEDQRREDLRRIGAYASKLGRITGHPVSLSREGANLHVLVVNEDERRSLAAQLPALVPGISPWMVRTIARMKPGHLCMVVAEPHRDPARGYAQAVAILRAEQSDLMRASCVEEELAQAMGLPNDCDEARPSIFNDDQEFAFLTERDEVLLRMLYSPTLASGMTARDAAPAVSRLAHAYASR